MTQMQNNPLVCSALTYGKRGWPVLPLHPSGKAPLGSLVPRGILDATCDSETIQHWWDTKPDANIGIRTGAVSGLVVLDVDPRHGGDDTLYELEQRHGKLPDTIESVLQAKQMQCDSARVDGVSVPD